MMIGRYVLTASTTLDGGICFMSTDDNGNTVCSRPYTWPTLA